MHTQTDTQDAAFEEVSTPPAQASAQPLAVIPSEPTPGDVLRYAMETKADIATLRELLQLKREWDADQARKAYHQALAAFKTEAVTILKDKTVSYPGKDGRPATSYDHATLGNVVETVTPKLGAHGLSHSWEPRREGDRVFVTCRITHRQGHSESITLDGPLDTSGSKNNIQSVGSTITYLQRYTLLSVLGLATRDQDDDGNGAGNGEPPEPPYDLTTWGDAIDAAVDMEGLIRIKNDWLSGASKTAPKRAHENFRALYNKRARELKGAAS